MSCGQRVCPALPLGSPFLSFPVSEGHLAVRQCPGPKKGSPGGRWFPGEGWVSVGHQLPSLHCQGGVWVQ